MGPDDRPGAQIESVSFADARCFQSDVSQFPLVTFYSADPTLFVPFGESVINYEITALMGESELTFISGWFEITFADDDGNETGSIFGEYLDFDLDLATSDYTVDWLFQGGTGDKENLFGGFGRTHGQADLLAGCAEYAFEGTLLFGP